MHKCVLLCFVLVLLFWVATAKKLPWQCCVKIMKKGFTEVDKSQLCTIIKHSWKKKLQGNILCCIYITFVPNFKVHFPQQCWNIFLKFRLKGFFVPLCLCSFVPIVQSLYFSSFVPLYSLCISVPLYLCSFVFQYALKVRVTVSIESGLCFQRNIQLQFCSNLVNTWMFQHHLQMRVRFSKQEYLLHMFIMSINCIWCIFTRLCATLMITIICGTINKHVYICTGDRTTFSRGRMVQGGKILKKFKTSVLFLVQA